MSQYKTSEAQRRASQNYRAKNKDKLKVWSLAAYHRNKDKINADCRAKRLEARIAKGLLATRQTPEQRKARRRFMYARRRVAVMAAKKARRTFVGALTEYEQEELEGASDALTAFDNSIDSASDAADKLADYAADRKRSEATS